jgi:triacylglycerol lipase
VRYFSVAARAPSANVWHPLWLPKLVLNGAEKRAAADAEWGNDGLVSVQSARWGEFLGTIEGAEEPCF